MVTYFRSNRTRNTGEMWGRCCSVYSLMYSLQDIYERWIVSKYNLAISVLLSSGFLFYFFLIFFVFGHALD